MFLWLIAVQGSPLIHFRTNLNNISSWLGLITENAVSTFPLKACTSRLLPLKGEISFSASPTLIYSPSISRNLRVSAAWGFEIVSSIDLEDWARTHLCRCSLLCRYVNLWLSLLLRLRGFSVAPCLPGRRRTPAVWRGLGRSGTCLLAVAAPTQHRCPMPTLRRLMGHISGQSTADRRSSVWHFQLQSLNFFIFWLLLPLTLLELQLPVHCHCHLPCKHWENETHATFLDEKHCCN